MLALIKGTVVETNPDQRWAVVDTGAVGYLVFSPPHALKDTENKVVQYHTHVVYSETEQKIFGFIEKIELNIFKHLIQVNGVGPKSALEILATYPKDQFIEIMFKNDDEAVQSIAKVKGIGKKTAQTLFISVKEKLMMLSNKTEITAKQSSNGDISEIVLQALYNFGYTHSQITNDSSWYDSTSNDEQNIKNFFQQG